MGQKKATRCGSTSSEITTRQTYHQAMANLIKMRITPNTATLPTSQSKANSQNDSDASSDLEEFSNTSTRSAARSVELHDIPIQEELQTTTHQAPPQYQSVQNTCYPVLKGLPRPHLHKGWANSESLPTYTSNIPASQKDPEVTKSSTSSVQQNSKSNPPLASLCEPHILLLDLANKNPHMRNELQVLGQLFQSEKSGLRSSVHATKTGV